MSVLQKSAPKNARRVQTWYPARSNHAYIFDRPITHEAYAASYNNFYEFSVFKGAVYKKAARLIKNLAVAC